MQRSADPQCTTFLVSRRPQPSLDGRTAISTIIFIIAFIIIIILIIFIGTITIIFVNILFLFCFCCLIIYQHCSSNMSEVKTENCQKPEWFRCPEIYSFGGHKVTKSLLCISMYLINRSVLSAYTYIYVFDIYERICALGQIHAAYLATSGEYQLVPSPTTLPRNVCSNL